MVIKIHQAQSRLAAMTGDFHNVRRRYERIAQFRSYAEDYPAQGMLGQAVASNCNFHLSMGLPVGRLISELFN